MKASASISGVRGARTGPLSSEHLQEVLSHVRGGFRGPCGPDRTGPVMGHEHYYFTGEFELEAISLGDFFNFLDRT